MDKHLRSIKCYYNDSVARMIFDWKADINTDHIAFTTLNDNILIVTHGGENGDISMTYPVLAEYVECLAPGQHILLSCCHPNQVRKQVALRGLSNKVEVLGSWNSPSWCWENYVSKTEIEVGTAPDDHYDYLLKELKRAMSGNYSAFGQ